MRGEINDLYSRDWGAQEWMIVTNANFATNGQPANIAAPFVKMMDLLTQLAPRS